MNEETKQAFQSLVRSRDGDLIHDYFEAKMKDLLDVRKATSENFMARGLAATFIEQEVLSKFKLFNERISETGDDTFI